MVFITAQPHDLYFCWQIEVQIVNFRKFGISDKMHVLVWFPDNELRKKRGEPVEEFRKKDWDKLITKYPEVKFFFYKDKGLTVKDFKVYIPQLRPQILARHFKEHPYLENEVIFYHDSDIIFNYLPPFDELEKGDICWQSDTSGYLDYNYLSIKEKQGNIPNNEAIVTLCQIGGITTDTLMSYKGKTGGAQYILKGINWQFWEDIERQVYQIRKAFSHDQVGSINNRYFKSENAGFQSWCADMWAINMALWSRGKITDVTKLLDFSWATDTAETYLSKPIYHNAGANGTQKGVFYKTKWQKKSPIGYKHAVDKKSASYYYVKAIEEVKK